MPDAAEGFWLRRRWLRRRWLRRKWLRRKWLRRKWLRRKWLRRKWLRRKWLRRKWLRRQAFALPPLQRGCRAAAGVCKGVACCAGGLPDRYHKRKRGAKCSP